MDKTLGHLGIEALFLLLAVIFIGGIGRYYRKRNRKKSAWISVLVVAIGLALLRRWVMDLDFLQESAGELQDRVDDWEWEEVLEDVNTWIYERLLPLGVPGALLLGYLFRGITQAGLKLLWRIPALVLGSFCIVSGYYYFSGEVDSPWEGAQARRRTTK